jgi:hypothetical protein
VEAPLKRLLLLSLLLAPGALIVQPAFGAASSDRTSMPAHCSERDANCVLQDAPAPPTPPPPDASTSDRIRLRPSQEPGLPPRPAQLPANIPDAQIGGGGRSGR